MGIFDRFFKKESQVGFSLYRANRQAKWSKRNYSQFADEGYRKNVIAYQAINKVARAVAQIPWQIESPKGEIVTNLPIAKAIENPNPLQDRQEFLEASVGFYLIAGNQYWERSLVSSGRLIEFYNLRPDRTTVELAKTGLPSRYIYKVGETEIVWEADPITGFSNVRHIKTFNPLDDVYGLSPIEAGAYSIDQHNESSAWIQSMLQNGAAPTGALTTKDTLPEEVFNRLKSEFEDRYTGSENAGRPLLLEGGLEWQQMGLSPDTMRIIETKYSTAREIALALGVPPLLLNIPGDSTYSNYKEARLAFYEETVIPLAEKFVREFNSWNAEHLKGNKVKLMLDEVPAIVDRRLSRWEMADKSTDLTINERRRIKGYPEIEGGDQVYIPSSSIPLSFDLAVDRNEPDDDEAKAKAKQAYGFKSE